MHNALWDSLENILHWLIFSTDSQGTRVKLYIDMVFIKVDFALNVQGNVLSS